MATYFVPLIRQGRFVGVIAVDLATDCFQELRDGIDGLSLGANAYFIIASSGGTILSHPDDRYEFPGEYSHLDQRSLDDSFRLLRQRWTTEPKGSGRAIDFFLGEPAEFHFAHVPAAGWTVLAVSREAPNGRVEPADPKPLSSPRLSSIHNSPGTTRAEPAIFVDTFSCPGHNQSHYSPRGMWELRSPSKKAAENGREQQRET